MNERLTGDPVEERSIGMRDVSPCESCTRALDPRLCEDKTCVRWRKWYLARWSLIHGFYENCKKAVGK